MYDACGPTGGKPNCWSTNHRFCERMNALNYDKHINVFVTQFNEDPHDHSNPEKQDEINDLVEHVLNIFDTSDDAAVEAGGSIDNDAGKLQNFFKISSHNLSHLATIHTFTLRFPSVARRTRENSDDFRGALVGSGAAKRNTGRIKKYTANCDHVGCRPNIDASKEAT